MSHTAGWRLAESRPCIHVKAFHKVNADKSIELSPVIIIKTVLKRIAVLVVVRFIRTLYLCQEDAYH